MKNVKYVRRLCALVAASLLVSNVAAAKEVTLPVEGRLSTPGGGPVADGKYAIVFGLYTSVSAAKPAWQEKAIGVQVRGGMFSWLLGPKAVLALDDALFASKATLWLGVSVAGEKELPRVRLGHVAYAAWANAAGWAKDLKCTACVDSAALAPAAVKASHVAFSYAGSKSKGGPALNALTAEAAKKADLATKALSATKASTAGYADKSGSANTAKTADSATKALSASKADTAAYADKAGSAKTATTANSALSAAVATAAKSLQCSNCVGPGMLAATVNKAIFAKPAPLGENLDFASKQALHMRLQTAAKDPLPCSAKTIGLVYYNISKQALMICNGDKFNAFAFAAPPGDKSNPGASCNQLLENGVTKSGLYWVKLGNATLQVHCDQQTDGGGWTRMMSARWSFFFSNTNWQNLNANSPLSKNYSILQHRTAFKKGSKYTLRFTVGNSGDWNTTNPAHMTAWTQDHDPFTQTTNGGDFKLLAGEKSSTCGGFNGLHHKYQGFSKTSDPDSGDSNGCWWMQVVPTKNYNSKGYLEGYGGTGRYHQWQVLWYR